jgi:hypothetical protein
MGNQQRKEPGMSEQEHPMLTMLKERFDSLAKESKENLDITRELARKFGENLIVQQQRSELLMIHDKMLRGDGNGSKGLIRIVDNIQQERRMTGIRSLTLRDWLMVAGTLAAGAGAIAAALTHHV